MSTYSRKDTINTPKVTFGIIVLNGEPFIRYNLRAIYPFANQIIVVEGACPASHLNATPTGHSLDTTIETIKRFQKDEDIEQKTVLITAEDEGKPDGFWAEKDEMSQAYAKRATGDILWQIDADEFYHPEDMASIIEIFRIRKDIHAISFTAINFWGGPGYTMDGFSFRTTDNFYHRVFRWGKGFCYTSHRPPTVINQYNINLRSIGWLSADDTKRMKIYLYHYHSLFPKSVQQKTSYYSNANWHDMDKQKIAQWKLGRYDKLGHPFHVHLIYAHYSWLKRFNGKHPPFLSEMLDAVHGGKWPDITFRDTDDIERLLDSLSFRIRLPIVKTLTFLDILLHKIKLSLRTVLIHTPIWHGIQWLRGRI